VNPAAPQLSGFAPAPDDSGNNTSPDPQRALNIAIAAISSGINSAINTVQDNTGAGGG
jgi:hypothetical protein